MTDISHFLQNTHTVHQTMRSLIGLMCNCFISILMCIVGIQCYYTKRSIWTLLVSIVTMNKFGCLKQKRMSVETSYNESKQSTRGHVQGYDPRERHENMYPSCRLVFIRQVYREPPGASTCGLDELWTQLSVCIDSVFAEVSSMDHCMENMS